MIPQDIVKLLGQSPLGALVQGKPDQFMPRVEERAKFFNEHPQNVSLAGEMQETNPFSSGLIGPHAKTSALLGNPLVNPQEGIYRSPYKMSIGKMQQAEQMPDLTTYEQASNANDTGLMDSLMQKHPGDARFAVHKTVMSLLGQK